MDPRLREAVARLVSRHGDTELTVVGATPLSGGSIHSALRVELSDGSHRFVKHGGNRSRARVPPDHFEREAEGLAALAEPGVIRVPRDPLPGEVEGVRFLVMEAIETGRPSGDFFVRFGRAFAELHRRTPSSRPGFAHDNYLGSTPQPNGWMDRWTDFFRSRRLGFQLDLARRSGHATRELSTLGERLLGRLDELLETPGEPCCLLHGDLWSGNFLADAEGSPVLIDPAVYYGHREADLAMTRLFGGFDHSFYDAYDQAWPLPAGSAERQRIYQLYHLLNHLNLFGGGYLSGCLDILRRFA